MASFTGTLIKCKVCEKTVYLVDQLIADGLVYHKACFRCNHCKSTLKLGSFASIEGVLYCKPHFQQLFKQTGSYNKSFETAIKQEQAYVPPPETTVGDIRARIKQMNAGGEKKPLTNIQKRFSGTQDKCVACTKTVYPLEKVSVENTSYHKGCFKCVHGGCRVSLASYAALEGKLYCKPHYHQLFASKGNLSELQKKSSAPVGDVKAPAEAVEPAAAGAQ